MATGCSWAEVAQKKKPAGLQTECSVNLEQFSVPRRLPFPSSRHSAFLPLPSGFVEEWLDAIIDKLPASATGVVSRTDVSLFEVCFLTGEVQQDFINSPFTTKHFTTQPLPPAGTASLFVPIKMINVPVLSKLIIEQQLRKHWGQFGDIISISPHTVKGCPTLLTNHWDMVLKLPNNGSSLSAPPLFDFLDFKVMASWPNSDKACPRCKTVGHDSRGCPRRPNTKKPTTSKSRKTRSSAPPPPTPPTTLATVETAPRSASPIMQSSSSAVDTPTADLTSEIDMDTDTVAFPFQLNPTQVSMLNAMTADQWVKHCQNVRATHPRTEPEIEQFLSLPLEEIVRIFHDAVQYLATHNYQPPPSTSTPSSSTATPTCSTPVSTVIPPCLFTLSATDHKKL